MKGWLSLALVFLLGAVVIYGINRFVPAQHLPWHSLDPDRPIGWATKTQLFRVAVSPSETCMSLARDIQGFKTLPSDPREASDPCGWDVARIVYSRGETQLLPGEANMQCPLSVATFLWMRELEQLAQKRYDQGLAAIHHMGTYSCRRQRGNGSGQWSEHAFANAWDIGAFELEDGTIIRVLTDWNGDNGEHRRFLRDARDTACRVFNVTLSPDFNAAHKDHFHVDMGPYSSCR
jgi:hypothetical protein